MGLFTGLFSFWAVGCQGRAPTPASIPTATPVPILIATATPTISLPDTSTPRAFAEPPGNSYPDTHRHATFHTNDPEEADDFLEHAHAFGRDRKGLHNYVRGGDRQFDPSALLASTARRRCSTREIRKYRNDIVVA